MQTFKKILEYGVLGGLFIVPFIPFIVPGEMFFPFITGKGFTFRILVEIIFGLYVILAFIAPQYRPKFSWITKSILAFVVIVFIADIFGENPYKSLWSNFERMEGFVLIAHLLLYYLTASSVLNSHVRWNRFFNTSIVASVLMSFYGLLQIAGKIDINQGGVRLDGTFGNASYFAIYLVFHIFLSLYMLVSSTVSKKWQKWAYGLIAILETCILYFTATRGAILGFIGGLLLAGIIIAWKERQNPSVKKFSYTLLAVIVVGVLLFIPLRKTSFVEKSPVLSRFSSLSFSEFKSQGRYFVWPMALKGFAEKPILGWGQESFNFVFNKYYDPGLYGQEEWFDRTHNIFLDWLIAAGILGLVSYLLMYVALFYAVWRKENSLTLSQKAVFTGMIAAYFFHNIFVFDNLISYIFFFSFLAYFHSLTIPNREVNNPAKVFSSDMIRYVITPVTLVCVVLVVYFVNVPALRANKTIIAAISPNTTGLESNLELFKKIYSYNSFGSTEATEQLVTLTLQMANATAIPNETKQKFAEFAREKIEEKVKNTPKDARYLMFAGSFFGRLGQPDIALEYLNRALAESPNKQSIYFELGSVYLAKGDRAKMFEMFKKAYDLKPSARESKILYTVGALYTNNSDVIKQMATELDQEALIYDNRILKAYMDLGDANSVINILTIRVGQNPNNINYKLDLASAYAAIGQKQTAIRLLREAIALEPSFKEQGEAYIKQLQGN